MGFDTCACFARENGAGGHSENTTAITAITTIVTTVLTTTTTSTSTSESQDTDIAPPEDDKYSEGLEFTYEGVYAAMMSAMRGNSEGGGSQVKVYLDGKEVASSVEKAQPERGASLMGNEVYSY